jgi:hypothetical protein
MPAAPAGTEVIPHDAGIFGDRSQGRGPAPDSSPPGPLEAAVGAAGAVELVQRPHVLIRELKVEDLRVLFDTLAVCGLGQHDEVALERPADQDLGWRPSQALGDVGHPPVAEMAAGAERAVGLQRHAMAVAGLQRRAAERKGAELDLVDDRGTSATSSTACRSDAPKFETPIERAYPRRWARCIPSHAHVGPPCGQWMR